MSSYEFQFSDQKGDYLLYIGARVIMRLKRRSDPTKS
jgi:hypothetical protein